MKIDRKKIVNRCGYDQNECMLLAKRLSECPDEALIPELKKISVWNYGKCELGLWADVLDRLDAILERAVTKVGKWMLRLDTSDEASLVDDVVTILEFTGHLIEHSIYRYLYGSWNHILALFGSENMDILLAVLGLSYNFSKRSNYFIRLDPYNKKMVLDRLVSIAETWGGAENNFGLAACCDPQHFPETAGNIYFEYRPDKAESVGQSAHVDTAMHDTTSSTATPENHGRSVSSLSWNTSHKIVMHALHKRKQSPSQIMEELLSQHPVPVSKQMSLFARVRLATYFADPEQRHKCIRARLQALSILSYTFDVDERHLYPNLLDELVEVLELPDGQYMGIKACALRTMTAIVNSHRLGVDWASLVGSTGLSSYHGILPNLTRRWIQGLVEGTIEAPGGSTNQQFTTALLSFLYHLACYEENVGSGNTQSATLSSSGVLDTMLQLISWHTSRNDYLSYVTRAVRVTDQILMSISSSRQHVVTILVDRLNYEVDLVLRASKDTKALQDSGPALNTQRSGLMKSMLSLLKRLCLDTEWSDVMQAAMDGNLPNILRRIFLNGPTHFTPHLALFAMEAITNYLYTYPSRISTMQDKHITTDILKALTDQPLPQNRDFLVQLPGLFNTLALNSRGIEAIQSSGVLSQYLDTLVSSEYLPTMKTKRVRDFLSQISYNPTSGSGQSLSNSLTASQMSNAIQELLRSHKELKPTVFQGLVACLKRVVELGNAQPATLIPEPVFSSTASSDFSSQDETKASTSLVRAAELQTHPSGSASSSRTVAAGGGTHVSNHQSVTPGTSHVRSDVMLDDDVVMLSGGEDEDDDDENDIDDVTRATQTAAAAATHESTQNTESRSLDSRSVSPATSLNLKDGAAPRGSKLTTLLPDGTPIPPQMFLSDFMLNTCKFLEKLLPSVLPITEAMCRHFVSQGGLQVLCDLLHMPGLPYDFPVSAACASLCKIFEDLANSININDVIEPLFQCLESSLTKLSTLYNSQFQVNSILLMEYIAQEHTYLHELVVTASIICIMVQIIDHLKPELRSVLADKWTSRSLLTTLGRLYLGVSWEAGILLTLLSGDKEITEDDLCPSKQTTAGSSSFRPSGNKPNEADQKVALDTEPIPQFVEALHIYTLLKPLKKSSMVNQHGFLHRRPELVKATHRILHVTAFLINSVTELFTAWGRFFANRNQVSYRRRRMNLMNSEPIPSSIKDKALSQVSQVLTGILSWEVPSAVSNHSASPRLLCAMRYAAVRMTNLLLHDPNHKGPQGGMLHAFFFQGGVQRYFGLFRELINLDLNNAEVREPLAEVLEEWLACAGRISNTDHIATELRRISDTDSSTIDVGKYVESIHQSMLFPLEQLCVRSDLQNLLTRRAVEHLLSMLVSIVPYLFNTAKQSEDEKVTGFNASEPTATDTTLDSVTALESVSPDDTTNASMRNATLETVDIAMPTQDPTLAQDSLRFSVNTGNESSQALTLPRTDRPDSPVDVANISELPNPNTEATPMETTNAGSISQETDRVRDPSALQLMEEMGFPRDLALVALEQTDWNANEAVNLVIATPAEDLLSLSVSPSTIPSRDLLRAPARNRDHPGTFVGVSGDETTGWSVVNLPATAPERSSASSSLAFLAASMAHCIDEASFTRLSAQSPSVFQSSTTPPDATQKDTMEQSTSSFHVDLMPPEKVSALRESLKQNAFRACYAIAKLHHSDQILHRIAELLLSSGEEERYINQLFGFVATSISSRLGLTIPSGLGSSSFESGSTATFECDSVLTAPVNEHPTVGLHLSALLFTRCQSLCARLAWEHDLPRLLVLWVSRVDWAPTGQHGSNQPDSMDVEKTEEAERTCDSESSRDPTMDYFQTMLLATLILDQYERSVQAMELRKLSVKLYAGAHNWHWFDDRAMLWHPYTTESTRAIDNAYHKGDLCAYCHISRRPYCVEFPTMTQMNLDSMHRRPALLFPPSGSSVDGNPTEYERSTLKAHIPPALSPEQRKSLYVAILYHFESVSKLSRDASGPPANGRIPPLIPSDCVNAMLRLLLRLAYSSYNDASEIADMNFLTILLNFPHEREFSPEYSAFVGTLLTQIFDDEATVNSVMKDVLHRMSQFGVPSGYMGIGASQVGCRDLFYLLSMCAPLFAKDRKAACKLACEVMSLSLLDENVQAKTVPKTYYVEPATDTAKSMIDTITLSPRQKAILTLLIELIVHPPNPSCSRKLRFAPTASCSCIEDVDLHPDNDAYTTMATGAPTLITCISPASSTTTTTWTSGLTLEHLSSVSSYQHQHQQQQPHSQQPALTDTSSTSTLVSARNKCSSKMTNIVLLGKTDAIRYLIDLIASYRSVAEFVALYKLPSSDGVHGSTERSASFLSHLFTHELNHPETTELTTSLLENLVLICSEQTQATIINEFKNSLGRIATPSSSLSVLEERVVSSADALQSQKNDCLASHMIFLERLLSLPTSLVNRLIRIIYKRHIPADIAKLIAVVECNLPNTQSTLGVVVRTLESLTWVERQISKLVHNNQDQTSSISHNQNRTNANHSRANDQPLPGRSATTSGAIGTDQPGTSTLHLSGGALSATDDHPGSRSYETDSDDDDDDDDQDMGGQHQHNQERQPEPGDSQSSSARTDHARAGVASSSTAALNMVLENVLMGTPGSGGLMRSDSSHQGNESRSAWHHSVGPGDQDESIIFVHDDEEDEGSAGQGGEGENSQEDDVMDDDEDEDDEDEDEEDEDGEGEEDEDREDEHDDDDDVSGDEEVAFVLRSGPQQSSGGSGRLTSGSRRHRRRNDTTISVSVSGNRVTADLGPLQNETDDVDHHDNDDEEADLMLHNEDLDDDDDVLDTFERDEDEDIRLPQSSVPSHIFLSPAGQLVRGSNPVVAMVEEVFNLVDVPHHVTATLGNRVPGSRRDRLGFAPTETADTSLVQSGAPLGNWDVVFPGLNLVDGLPLRAPPPPPGFGIPHNAPAFRFGLSNGSGVFVTSGSSNRIAPSGMNFLTSGTRIENVGSSNRSQVLPPPTLASQHPILQIPSIPSASHSQTPTTTSVYGSSGMPTGNGRLSRTVITNASTTPSTTRMTSALPPMVPQQTSTTSSVLHHGHRSRVPGGSSVPIVIGNSGIRQRGPPTRLYGNIDSSGARSHTALVENVGAASTPTQPVDLVRDNRSGPEADSLVWSMLTSFAEDQPSSVNSALASAIFSQAETRTSTGANALVGNGATQFNGLTNAQLSSYAGYALPSSYRQWINLSRMLFGHELMDLILISRYNVYVELAQRRQKLLDLRVKEAEELAAQQAASEAAENEGTKEQIAVEAPEGPVPLIVTSHTPEAPVDAAVSLTTPHETSSGGTLDANPIEASVSILPGEGDQSTPTGSENQGTPPEVIVEQANESSGFAAPSTSVSDANALRPLTDEETIQSLVEGGMDPSFLDALPEDMRSEVIADHRHARQVQQRLRSITLPEHINSDWLAGLPLHIQEEVLNQFRQEQQQQQQQRQQEGTAGTTEGTAQRAPENNTAFLLSLPATLRREVLADMEESQFEMLPPELAAEARQLRREHEERIARTVQNGVLTQSFNTRTQLNIWRNLTSASGLIGGSGRWDVRFRSINQFLRYLRNTLGGPTNTSALLGLHTSSTGRGRYLVDHEGLTCLIVLLIVSSSCSQQRRHIIPTVKKVLRNLSCHYGTRNWIVGTLLSLFDGLSEKSQVNRMHELQCESYDGQSSSGAKITPNTIGAERTSSALDVVRPGPLNSVFNIGFEAALGCWVRVFHPLPQTDDNTMNSDQTDLSADHTAARPSSTLRGHIIHPQAAVSVASVLLDTLAELARAFPAHFYPRSPDSRTDGASTSVGETYQSSSSCDQLRPSFWEIFDRLSQSPPSIASVQPATRPGKRLQGSSRKRQTSISSKPITTDPANTPAPVPVEVTHPSCATTQVSSDKPDVVEGPTQARRRVLSSSSTSYPPLDCFNHLADLLCHPLLHDRPMHQERILSILAGIVKEFVIVRGQSTTSGTAGVRPTETTGETAAVTESSQPQPQASTSEDRPLESTDPGTKSTDGSVTSTCGSSDLIGTVRVEVIKTLCNCVLSPKATDTSRNMTAQLITDLAKSNRTTKDTMLKLLCESAGLLASKIVSQLQDLIDEIDLLKPNETTQPSTSDSQIYSTSASPAASSSNRLVRTSFDVLPDRFSSSGQVVVISSDSRSSQPTNALADLQLKSVQVFSCPNSDQTRFRSLLGLILRIASGDCSINLSEPIPMCAHDPFQSMTILPEFWSRLSLAFEKLTTLPESNAVLLLQPLLEAFCLAHLYLVKDSIMIRQRSTISRSVRSNQNSMNTLGLIDMVPILQLRAESPSSPVTDRGSQGDTVANEHTTHLHLDVVGPLSPPCLPMEEERSAGDTVHFGRASISSASNSNIILQFAEQHRTGLNQILRHYGNGLGESPLAVFLVYPRVLDFDIKRQFFRQQLQSLNGRSSVASRYDDEPIVISRDRIFEDSYARLHQKSPSRWKHKFVIRFYNEEGQDAGGPLREWYLLMSREIFNPNYCLFRTSPADRVTYTINPSSYINSNHLSYFKFVGRFIAKAIYDNKLLECYFSRSFYKHILGVPLKFSDLESDDYEFYKGLEFLLKNHVSDLGYELTFSTEINEFGKTDTRDLIENGRNVAVTEHNKREYVRLVCQERMTGAIRQQLDAFLGGFYEIIPKRLISVFNEQELELLISGLPNIDIADLRAHTTYSKYQSNSPQIEWFWRALESFDQEDRARFLQFVTGTSKVPLGGFANLEGIHGPTQFQISRATGSSTSHLPCAHTCFNTLVLPAYENYEHLRARLLTAIRECSEGYGMA